MRAQVISAAGVLVVVVAVALFSLTAEARPASACWVVLEAPAPDMVSGPDCQWYFEDGGRPLTEGQVVEANETWQAYKGGFFAAVMLAFVMVFVTQRWNARVERERAAGQM